LPLNSVTVAQTASDVYSSELYWDRGDNINPSRFLRVEPLSEKQSLAAPEKNYGFCIPLFKGFGGKSWWLTLQKILASFHNANRKKYTIPTGLTYEHHLLVAGER
jgi:hypothetical protein